MSKKAAANKGKKGASTSGGNPYSDQDLAGRDVDSFALLIEGETKKTKKKKGKGASSGESSLPVGDPTPDEKNTVDDKTVKSPDGGVEIKNDFPTPASDGGLSDDNSDPDLTDSEEEEENVEWGAVGASGRELEELEIALVVTVVAAREGDVAARVRELEKRELGFEYYFKRREEDLFKAYEARKELEDNLLKKKADIKRVNELAAREKLSELKLESDFIEREKILLDKKENLVETQRALMNKQGGMAKDRVTIQQMLLGRWKKNVEKEKMRATLEADLGARAELEAREADLIHRENDIV
ncbi:hypothetical protein Tco_0771607 [Tanacetum coccineum]|uniref:DUF4201 domain-containing protein n=1 Tax=Tanacetum coccineum TaxID=301880 RepID=A0ABQ4ZGV5_9ASTR